MTMNERIVFSYIHNHTSYRITLPSSSSPHHDASSSHNHNNSHHQIAPKLEVYNNQLEKWEVATLTTTPSKRIRKKGHVRSHSHGNHHSDSNTLTSFQKAFDLFTAKSKQQVKSQLSRNDSSARATIKLPYIPISLSPAQNGSSALTGNYKRFPFRQLPEDAIYYIISFTETTFDQNSNFDIGNLYGRFARECRFLHPNIAMNSNVRYLYGKRKGFQKGIMRIIMHNVVNIKFFGSRMNRFLLQFFGSIRTDDLALPMLRTIKLPMHASSSSMYTPVIATTAPLLPPAPPLAGLQAPTLAIGAGHQPPVPSPPLPLLNLTPIYDLLIKHDQLSESEQEENKNSFKYKPLIVNLQLLTLTDVPNYLHYFDNVTDLRIMLDQNDIFTTHSVQTIMKSGKLRRLRLECETAMDAPANFFKMVLTRSLHDENDEDDDTLSPAIRVSSSLQVLELENIYLIGSVLLGIDINKTLQYLSIRYTCNDHHMFVLGRGDAILLNRNRSLKYLTGDLSLTPEFLSQFKSETLRVLQLSPKFVPHVISSADSIVNPPPPPINTTTSKLTSVIASGTVNNLIKGLLNGKGTLTSSHDQRIPLSQFLHCPNLQELYIHYDQIDFKMTSLGLDDSLLQLKDHKALQRVVFYTNNDTFIGNITHVSAMESLIPHVGTSCSEQTGPLIHKVQVICALLRNLIPNVEFLLYTPNENNSLGKIQWW